MASTKSAKKPSFVATDSDSAYSSSGSDVNNYKTIAGNRTPNEIKAFRRFHHSLDRKEDLITHAVSNAYTRLAPPTLPVFLNLFFDIYPGTEVIAAGKRVTKRCIKSLVDLIGNTMDEGFLGELIQTKHLGSQKYKVYLSVGLLEIVDTDKFKIEMLKNGVMKEKHAAADHNYKKISPSEDALPISRTRWVNLVMNHIITQDVFNNPSNMPQQATGSLLARASTPASSSAHFASEPVTLTKADAKAGQLKKKAHHLWIQFMRINIGQFQEQCRTHNLSTAETSWPVWLTKAWELNGGQDFDYHRKVEYQAWCQSIVQTFLLGNAPGAVLPDGMADAIGDEAVSSGESD